MKRLRSALLAWALLAAATWARALDPSADLGEIRFATSGSPEAQAHFLRGALLLHSFEYDDAAAEFRQAQLLDPDFAMAYWGEAMTFNHPLWMERDADGARKVLGRLGPTPDARAKKAPTPREKMYLEAVEILYADGEKADRDRAYAEAMRALYERYPEDLDAASLYALALLGTCEGKRDFAIYMRAAAIAEEVFAKNPRHPGAAHYLIHSYDDPIHAPLGMRPARVYAQIAPAATHALHMPSHIFLALGMWDRVVASNEASWKASVDRAARLKLSADAHSFHALSWLGYAYLQEGRWKDARRTLAMMEEDAHRSGSQKAREHLVKMRAAYVVETGQWGGEAARLQIDAEGLPVRNLNTFIEGLVALAAGDRAGAEAALARIKESSGKDGGTSGHTHGGAAMTYAGAWSSTDAVLLKELEARILFDSGRTEEALALAREAVEAEDAMSFDFGPPDIVKPSHEMLGEMLLAANHPAEAQVQFEASLARAPRRAQSLLGLARAATKAGDTTHAASAYAQLREIWSGADTEVVGLQEVRRSSVAGS